MGTKIDWNFPKPGRGFKGALERFIGPGATGAEIWLQFGLAFLFALGVVFYAYIMHLEWRWWQYLAGFLLGADISGGILTNATSSAKRWYHKPGMTKTKHFGFVLMHILQIFIVSWVFMDLNWSFIMITYGYLLGGSLVILTTKQYLRRPVALFVASLGILVAIGLTHSAPGMVWFAPFLYIKILVSHLLKEEPYYPEGAE